MLFRVKKKKKLYLDDHKFHHMLTFFYFFIFFIVSIKRNSIGVGLYYHKFVRVKEIIIS